MRSRICLAVFLAALTALGYLKSYEVTPTQASWSGWTRTIPGQDWVGNTFTANFDSICYCDVFLGDTGQSHAAVVVEVREYPNGAVPIAYNGGVAQTKSHVWLNFPLTTVSGQKFTRGKEYLLKVTRPGDSVNYYTNFGAIYPYGHIVVGGQDYPTQDLCARIYGKARVGDEFAVHSNIMFHRDTSDWQNWADCVEREKEVGVKLDKVGFATGWTFTQPGGPGQWNWHWFDTLITQYSLNEVRPYASFTSCAPWADCAEYWEVRRDTPCWTPGSGIPKNLFEPVRHYDTMTGTWWVNDSNYYAKYVYEFVRRYGPRGYSFNGQEAGTFWRERQLPHYVPVTFYESFDEVPARALRDIADPTKPRRGFWRTETSHASVDQRLVFQPYRETLAAHIAILGILDGRRTSLLSAYSRLVVVMDSAIDLACADPEDSATVPRSGAYIEHCGAYSDGQWFPGLKSFGVDTAVDYITYFSFNRLLHGLSELPEGHSTRLLDWRAKLRTYGFRDNPFWITSFGTTLWEGDPEWSQEERAHHLQRAYAVMQATNVVPPGQPAEACAWFTFTGQYMPGCWGIIDSEVNDWQSWASGHAYTQLSSFTRGASFTRWLPPRKTSDSVWCVPILQYEDSIGRRAWIAWNPHASWPPDSTVARLPVRTDDVDSMSTDTDGTPNVGSAECALDGWLELTIDTIPLFITEHGDALRPDLAADSMRLVPPQPQVGMRESIYVWVKNNGNRATPGYQAQDSIDEVNPTVAYLCWNDTLVDSAKSNTSIAPGATRRFAFCIPSVPIWMHGHGLVQVAANPGQRYVELGMDDNSAYKRVFIPRFPTGVVDAVVPPGGKTDAALLPIRLTSHSWETDSTGQTPADSARIIFSW